MLLGELTLLCNIDCGGTYVSAYAFPAATISAITGVYLIAGDKRAFLKSLLIATTVAIAALAVAAVTFDYSIDGNTYHQEAIALMMQGWNPYYAEGPLDYPVDSFWIYHYAKGMEIAEACLGLTFGNIEIGKGVNLMLVVSAFLIVYALLRRYCPLLLRLLTAALAAFVTLNPVCVGQLLTFYFDYVGYLTILFCIAGYVMLRERPSVYGWALVVLAVFLSVSVKFNFIFYTGVAVAGCMLKSFIDKDFKFGLIFGAVALATVLLTMGLCWHPYATNYISHGSPLWPIVGKDPIDVVAWNIPEALRGHGRVRNFFFSHFSMHVPHVERRIGGFGPFMGLMLIISAFAMIKWRREIPRYVIWGNLAIFLLCFLFYSGWWARYVYFLWLIPASTAVCLLPMGAGDRKMPSSRLARIISYLFIAFGLLTAGMTLAVGIRSSWRETSRRARILEMVEGREVKVCRPYPPGIEYLREAGCDIKIVDKSEIDSLRRVPICWHEIIVPEMSTCVELTREQAAEISAMNWER